MTSVNFKITDSHREVLRRIGCGEIKTPTNALDAAVLNEVLGTLYLHKLIIDDGRSGPVLTETGRHALEASTAAGRQPAQERIVNTETSPTTPPGGDSVPDNYFDDPAAPAQPPAAPEEAAPRKRKTWPIRPMQCRDGGFFPIKGAPEFNELRDATDWIAEKCPSDEKWIPVRHPESAFRQTKRLEEVSPW